jgi:polyferredoxin
MEEVGREKGLIGYSTLFDYSSNMALATAGGTTPVNPALVRDADGRFSDKVRHFNWKVIFRPRIILYTVLWSLIGVGLVIALLLRDRLELDVLHDRNPQYVMESDGSIRNGYRVKILNMVPEPRNVMLSLRGMPGATMNIAGESWSQGSFFGVDVEPDSVKTIKLYVTMPKDKLPERTQDFSFHIEYRTSGEASDYTASFIVPERKNHDHRK